MNAVAVTDLSVVAPIGTDVGEFARRMFAGESGIRSVSEFIADSTFPVHCAGLLSNGVYPNRDLNLYSLEIEALLQRLLTNEIYQSIADSPIDGIIYGTNDGIAKPGDLRKFYAGEALQFDNLHSEHGLDYLLHALSQKGHPPIKSEDTVICANGCITGLLATSYAWQRIRSGQSRKILVICDEIRVRPEELLKYNALGALSRDHGPADRVSRPFSKTRSGFVKGEGAGMMILEDAALAKKRGAKIRAYIEGFGQTSDAWRLTDGREDMKGVIGAMHKALQVAGVGTEQIDYINAHGTSTVKNDFLESEGIKKVFGKRSYDIPVSSLKSQIGHLNIACGIVETIASILMLEEQRIAPTINWESDPLCDLNYVPNKSVSHKMNYILKNSFGFGGANAAVVLRRG